MPRLAVIRAALAGLLTLGVALGAAGAPATAAGPAPDGDPLLVHIDAMTPVLPRSGTVVISGTVTNVSDETYTRINLHAFSSANPILDSSNLASSSQIDPGEYVGERVTTPGTFATVDELAPGESATFTDDVPVGQLDAVGDPGVYWIGVHALGDTATTPRDGVAEGRARTFIPAQPRGDASVEAAVLLSVRGRVWYAEDGSLAGTDRWARRLADGGSLDGVLDMAESAGSAPYNFLVDPAVVLAIWRIANGNPPRSLAPDPSIPDQTLPDESETTTDGTDGTDDPGGIGTPLPEALTPTQDSTTAEPSEQDAALTAAATAWISRFQALAATRPVLTLPFGDLDVSAAIRNDPSRYDQAVGRSAEVMAGLAVPFEPTVSPVDGFLSPEALAAIPEDTLVLLGDTAFAVPPTSKSSVVRLLGHKVVVTSTGAESGGPGPTAATDPLALRQRLLSEAALRLVADRPAPVVVTLPTVWRGEDAASFFDSLEQSWLDLVPIDEVAAGTASGLPASQLTYTESDLDSELDASVFRAARRATDTAALAEQVLALQTTIELQARDEVLVTLSEQHRSAPGQGSAGSERLDRALRDDLAEVRIEAPKAVTLSSDSGPLGATLVNGLDQPVEVAVRVTTDGELTLSGGGGSRTLQPGARSVLRYEAATDRAGLHNVRLSVVSIDGTALGSSDELPIRAARVSAIIWFVMGAGALVLFGMIGYRLPGQIRARRAELAAAEGAGGPDDGPPDEPGDEPSPEPAPEPDPERTRTSYDDLVPERP